LQLDEKYLFCIMKKYLFVLIAFLTLGMGSVFAQGGEEAAAKDNAQALPVIMVKSLDGSSFSTGDFENDGKPIIISFWATWCKPCIQELIAINEEYSEWVKETGVKLIAISIDDARNAPKVAPFVEGRGWEYEVYIDENSDFKRAMSVNNVPHTFLLNAKKEIVWNHNSYTPGDEEELHEIVKKLAETGKIED
jgi:cytochrome c biogenesis protein CcmG, thiol:disulfide interchange protein DsbE